MKSIARPGANPIRQQLDNLNEAGSMYGAIIYQKAPIVMRHLEALLGEDNFRDGLREYLKAHAFANATWSDLIDVLDARTPMDLQQWSKVWVDQPGRPSIETILDDEERQRSRGSRSASAIRGTATASGRSSCASRSAAHAPQQITQRRDDRPRGRGASRRSGMPAPRYVLPNGGGLGLRRLHARQDDARLPDDEPAGHRRSADARQRVGHAVGRAARWTGARRTRFSISRCASLPRETDEQMTSRVLGYAVEHLVAIPRSAAAHDARGAIRIAAARRPGAGGHAEPEGVVVRHAAQHRADAGHGQLAAAGVGEEGNGDRAAARRSRLHRRSRSSSRCGRWMAGATSSRRSWRASRIPIAAAASSS